MISDRFTGVSSTMIDYRERFRSCGRNVTIAGDAHFDHPELIDVGDDVRISRGFSMINGP
jgi:hypothetical protein